MNGKYPGLISAITLVTTLLTGTTSAGLVKENGSPQLAKAQASTVGGGGDANSMRREIPRGSSRDAGESIQDAKSKALDTLSEIKDHNYLKKKLQADITMVTTPQSGTPQTWKGKIFIRFSEGKTSVRIKFAGYAPDILVVGRDVTVYVPWDGGHIYKTTLGAIQMDRVLYYVNPDDALTGNFVVTWLRTENNQSVLQSLPDGPDPIDGTRKVLTWVDETSWLPVKFEFEQIAVKRTITLAYKTPTFTDRDFQLEYPGVRPTTWP